MNTQLLCTFTAQNNLQQTVDVIVDTYDVLYNKIFILCNVEDNRELMCTYNIQKTQNFEILNILLKYFDATLLKFVMSCSCHL